MFQLSSDFWKSKTTWNALLAIAELIVVGILDRMDIMPYIVTIHGFLQTIFIRDAQAKVGEKLDKIGSSLLSRYIENVNASSKLSKTGTKKDEVDVNDLLDNLVDRLYRSSPREPTSFDTSEVIYYEEDIGGSGETQIP